MYYELSDVTDPENPVLKEKTYYEYDSLILPAAAGNPSRIVRELYTGSPPQPSTYFATNFTYNHHGELWFVRQTHWNATDVLCDYAVTDRITEFKGSGRARYLTRQRDPGYEGFVLSDTSLWSDYDGDTIYGDYTLTGAMIEVPPGSGHWQPETVEKTAYLPGIGQIDNITGAVTYYHADHIGTLRATTDASGALLARQTYTAFGEVVCGDSANDPCGAGVPPVESRYQYAGEYGYESALLVGGGLPGPPALPFQHVGHRWYDPSTGRFLQRDPIGIRGGLHVYEHAENTPTDTVDPLGMIPDPNEPIETGDAERDREIILRGAESARYMAACAGGVLAVRFAPRVVPRVCPWMKKLPPLLQKAHKYVRRYVRFEAHPIPGYRQYGPV